MKFYILQTNFPKFTLYFTTKQMNEFRKSIQFPTKAKLKQVNQQLMLQLSYKIWKQFQNKRTLRAGKQKKKLQKIQQESKQGQPL